MNMKQVKLYGPNDVRVDDAPIPQAGEHDIVVKVAACGICGSDLGFIANGATLADGSPMPIGHELSGEILEVGSAVKSLQRGLRVVIDPMWGENNIGTGSTEGGFAKYLLVKNAQLNGNVYVIPDTLSYEAAALVEPLAVAIHGVNLGNPAKNEKVAVIGAGPIGLATVAALKHRGIDDIAIADFSSDRLNRAEKLGATPVLASEKSFYEFLSDSHGSQTGIYGLKFPVTDLYIDCSGAKQVIPDFVNSAKPRSRLIVLGVPKQEVSIEFGMFVLKELSVKGAMCYPNEFKDAIDMLKSQSFDVSLLISHLFDVADFAEALETAQNADVSAKVVVRF